MELSTAKLSSIAKFSQGKQIPIEEQYMDTNEKRDRFIRIVDFTSGFREAPRYVDADDKYHVNSNEIIMIRYGTPGKVYRGVAGIIANNMFKITFDKSFIDTNYGYWFLKQNSIYNFLMMMNCSATMPAITFKMLDRVQVQFPVISIQRRIASILSAYDNLIENNNKRIRLLEQMAENLYKEWFVRFRFPGHEKAEFENGLPKGWKFMKLDKILTVKYGKDHSKIEDGTIPILGSGGIMRYGNKELYTSESVLIPRKGSLNNIMYIDEPFWTVDTMFFTEMKYKSIAKYIYYVLSGIDMESFNSGAALPSMTTNILNNFKVVLPSENVLVLFDKKVGLLFSQKKQLIQQNTLLSRQRDLLLPRLMSGKLEVNV